MQVILFLLCVGSVLVDARSAGQAVKRNQAASELATLGRKSLGAGSEFRVDTREETFNIDQREAPELVDMRSHMQQDFEQVALKQPGSRDLISSKGYSFGYQTDNSSHYETSDTKGVVRGQYTVRNADGSGRVVDYIADQDGFRAVVSTDELGTSSRSASGLLVKSLGGQLSSATKSGQQRYLDD